MIKLIDIARISLLGTCIMTFLNAQAGLIRHDRDDSLYTGLASQSQFDSVGQLVFGNGAGRASAILIGDKQNQWLLTAATQFHATERRGRTASLALSVLVEVQLT